MEKVITWISDPLNLLFGIPLGILILCLACVMPVQAKRRGHGFVSWFILQILSMNPLYLLVIVGLLPNKAKMRQREVFAAELEAKLRAVRGR